MTRPSRLSAAAFALALLALAVSLGGTTEAAGKIGKNLVVSRSIKTGAVTSAKVRDGSLTAADLKPGTLPAGPTKQVMMAYCDCIPSSVPGAEFAPVGVTPSNTSGRAMLVPVAVRLSDFDVKGKTQVSPASVTIYVLHSVPGVGGFRSDPVCTLAGGASTCNSTTPIDVAAGGELLLQAYPNTAYGAYAGDLEVSYTLQVTG